ncbi:DUF305 domain-containing protein [Pseudonocardia thermophila]|uniref:DUF305 domain-containing protein n=1 Tax=Pseudonocardia thermophila TaxID=1848 RepID=UPI00248F13E2|nr:DUF305 domain-containing protein [Pseudonocardia thermophila]
MRTIARALRRLTWPLMLTLLLTACGGERASALGTQPSDVNDADVLFVQLMIPHHQQAVDMAEVADKKATNPELRQLVDKIAALQDSEIKLMGGWLRSWGKPLRPGGLGHSAHSMPGMLSSRDLDKLDRLQGPAFDKLFLQLMIKHHKGAITMAKEEQTKGRSKNVKEMARWLITNQSAEIRRMEQILRTMP